MKSIINLIVTLAVCCNLHAQIESGRAIYSGESKMVESILNSGNKKSSASNFEKIRISIDQILLDVEFELLFADGESLFKVIDKLEQDKLEKFAIISTGGNGTFYINGKSKERLHMKEVFGEKFLIKDNIKNIKWKLHNEVKKIGEYNCYKASTVKIIENSKGVFKKQVTAWYSPELPAGFGPIGYGGLPGLIVELNIENKSKFLLKRISLNPKKKISIKKPVRGKLVSVSEYEKIVNESDSWVKKNKNK